MEFCRKENVIVKLFWGLILYYFEDFFFLLLRYLFDIYIEFRKNVEVRCRVRLVIFVLKMLKLVSDFIISDYIGSIFILKEFMKD